MLLLCRPGEGSPEEVSVHSGRGGRGQPGAASGAAVGVRRPRGGAEDRQHVSAAPPGGGREGQSGTLKHKAEQFNVCNNQNVSYCVLDTAELLDLYCAAK